MDQHFIGANGNYFVAIDPIATPEGAIAVPPRPASHWNWNGQAWVEGQADPAIVPPSISFAQLLIGLVTEGWITAAEGRAWRDRVALPAPVAAMIASLPEAQQFAAETRAFAPSEVLRNDPMSVSFGAAAGKTPTQMDAFFTTYASV